MSNRYSHSMLSLFRTCPLRFALHYRHHLVSVQPSPRHDPDFGAAWDEALNTLYLGGSTEAAQEAFAGAYPKDQYPDPLPPWSQGKSFQNGMAAIAAYQDRWFADDQFWDILSIQQRQDDDEERTLKLDLVVRDRRDGLVYGIDNKTTGQYLDQKYWSSFEPDSQVRSYADHINTKYGHCGGFIINATSFKNRSKAYTPRTGPDKGTQLPAGDWFRMERLMLNPNEACLQLERDNFAYWTERIAQDEAAGVWGYNTESCFKYGRPCEFLQLCEKGYTWPNDRELILSYYRQTCPRVLPEGRCVLDLDHEGEHSAELPRQTDFAIEEDAVEEGVV
jgi:hypothetical protein